MNSRQKALDGMWVWEDSLGSFEKKTKSFCQIHKIVDLAHKKPTIIDSLDNTFNHRWLGMEGLDLHCKILGFTTNHFLVSSIRVY